jgi:hypothetical protein
VFIVPIGVATLRRFTEEFRLAQNAATKWSHSFAVVPCELGRGVGNVVGNGECSIEHSKQYQYGSSSVTSGL